MKEERNKLKELLSTKNQNLKILKILDLSILLKNEGICPKENTGHMVKQQSDKIMGATPGFNQLSQQRPGWAQGQEHITRDTASLNQRE